MKRIFFTALLIAAVMISSCGKKEDKSNTNSDKSKFKVGLVFDVGGRGDKSFNDAAYKGLERAKKDFGIDFEVIDPGDGADRESALRKLASKPDISLIFGVGFIFTEDITKIAQDFPDKKFGCVDYSINPNVKIPDNLVALEFKEEEGSFLVGALACLTSRTKKLGFVGGMESALIRKFEKGFVQGAKYIDPECKIFVSYVSVTGEGFKNPGKAEEIAISQYSSGADIIYHASGLSGIGVFKAAKENKKFAIGVDLDQYTEAPGFVLTSMVKVVDEIIYNTILDMKNGSFKGGIKSLGLKDNGVGYVYDDNNKNLISPEVKEKVEGIKKKIIDGEIKVSAE
ncbi:MAG TPA: BMP family ABC transporter substrate-binding protein [Ignavibacteria bacterium]|nr:BMP family ABC transporter substrate-binding protein [Ignavibacteria bacterium]